MQPSGARPVSPSGLGCDYTYVVMDANPYTRFADRELSLADYLAIDRTVLANERTALAYGHTVLALLVVGGTCIKFFDSTLMRVIGVLFIMLALAVTLVGAMRFAHTRRALGAALERHTGDRRHPLKGAPGQAEATTAGADPGG